MAKKAIGGGIQQSGEYGKRKGILLSMRQRDHKQNPTKGNTKAAKNRPLIERKRNRSV